MDVAFLGLGNMGEPIARNLLRAGHTLRVFNRTASKGAALAQAGATPASSPAEAARGADVVMTMLANDEAVREVAFGDRGLGLLSALGKGAMHISVSTISVALSKELAREHSARGQAFVAAPVLGRPDAAAEKRLWIIAGGAAGAIERCRLVFDAIGRGVTVVGAEPWQANVTKIAANFMIASMLESMSEAMALVRKSAIDPHTFLEVVNGIFNSPVYANYGRIIANRAFEPAGFRLALGFKDVGLALAAGQDARVQMPIASVIRDQFLTAIAAGLQDADWSAVSEVASQNAGLEAKS